MEDFNYQEKQQIELGLKNGLDVSIYAKPEYNWAQMEELRKGLMNKVDVSIYAKPEYDWDQMQQLRKGLENKVDVSIYAKPEYGWAQMEEIRWFLQNNLELDVPLENQIVYGYKAFNRDMTCRGFQYKVGNRYSMGDEPVCCVQGFHFCLKLEDCYKFYDETNCIICKVKILGDIDTDYRFSKCCTNDIKILEIVKGEIKNDIKILEIVKEKLKMI